jgi:hypothetical protein
VCVRENERRNNGVILLMRRKCGYMEEKCEINSVNTVAVAKEIGELRAAEVHEYSPALIHS